MNGEPYLWDSRIEYLTGEAFDFKCPFCGASIFAYDLYHRAHIQPRGSGAGFVPGNIVLSCPPCNQVMTYFPAEEWCERHGIDFAPIEAKLSQLRAYKPTVPIRKRRDFRLALNNGVV